MNMDNQEFEKCVNEFLLSNPKFAQNWFKNNVNPSILAEWLNLEQTRTVNETSVSEQVSPKPDDHQNYLGVTRKRRNSVNSELFQGIIDGKSRSGSRFCEKGNFTCLFNMLLYASINQCSSKRFLSHNMAAKDYQTVINLNLRMQYSIESEIFVKV